MPGAVPRTGRAAGATRPAAPTIDEDALARVRAELSAWYPQVARDFPWRRPDRTPWGVLVSEVMAQQTPMMRVEPRWDEWMRRWPTPAAAAAAPRSDALRVWGNLGYPRRALRLLEAAGAIAADPALASLFTRPASDVGQVPADIDARLRALPGVGDYTAAAVAAFALGRRALVLDTNVRRVLARLFAGVDQPAGAPKAAERALAEAVWPDEDAPAAAWSAHVMELGALVCRARTPLCDECPVRGECAWLDAGSPRRDAPLARQAWAGTDRQARGRILAALRATSGAVTRREALAVATLPGADVDQAPRALASLKADGLVCVEGDLVSLPR
ncbi:MAG: A/G-specific adenine glycosylase [Actinomycetaceae bacterium]|nr:A/G-specific adenine glycosylase [Actinomycetaceae bacterium]MDU0970544.1 A/G-specific adenine glycosylase [Actinomycetaceae bacterium]